MDRLGFERPLPICADGRPYDPELTYQEMIDQQVEAARSADQQATTQNVCFPALPQCSEAGAILQPHDTYEEAYALGCIPVCEDKFILGLSETDIRALSFEEQVELLRVLGILDVDDIIPTKRGEVLALILSGQRRYAHPDTYHGPGSPCMSALFRATAPSFVLPATTGVDATVARPIDTHGTLATGWVNEHDGRFITKDAVVFCAECHGNAPHRILPSLLTDIDALRRTDDSTRRIPFLLEDQDPKNGCTTCHGLHDNFPPDLDVNDRRNQQTVEDLHPRPSQEDSYAEECQDCHSIAYRPGSPAGRVIAERETLSTCGQCHPVQNEVEVEVEIDPSPEDTGPIKKEKKIIIWEEE